MGYYIETDSHINKAAWIVANCGGQIVNSIKETKEGFVPVCVVKNAMFEAAGICYDKYELEAFSQPDDYRPKTWLLVPKEEVIKQCPRVEDELQQI